MRILLIFLIIVVAFKDNAQQFYTNLYGFRLGQYRDAAKTELGPPFKSGKFEDGFEYEAFLLKPDTSLYIVFEYAAKKTDIIWSIQVSGTNSIKEIGFKNAKLGMDEAETKRMIGKPSAIESIGKYGHKWSFENTNFSIEINKAGKLSSVKILDNSNDLFPTGPNLKKIPSFDEIRNVLSSYNNSNISKLLSGDIEIYYKDNVYYFKKSLSTEETSDYSQIFSIIKEISTDLATVVTKNPDEYEENMRLTLGENIKHVIKIKKGHLIKEIVLKCFGGQYYIYEINASTK